MMSRRARSESLALRVTALACCFMVIMCFVATEAFAAQPLPKITVDLRDDSGSHEYSVSLQILFLLTILSLAPAFLILMTSFTRIIVILHFLRQALGTQQMPPNQLLVGLAMFLTFFVMGPVWDEINREALQPYMNQEISQQEALTKAHAPIREFMLRQTRQKDLGLFIKMSKMARPRDVSEVPLRVIIPAFAISELRVAFQIGFLLFVPFIMIDMIVAAVLLSMGMMFLPPVMISLPIKILLFVLADGWYLIIGSIVAGFK